MRTTPSYYENRVRRGEGRQREKAVRVVEREFAVCSERVPCAGGVGFVQMYVDMRESKND